MHVCAYGRRRHRQSVSPVLLHVLVNSAEILLFLFSFCVCHQFHQFASFLRVHISTEFPFISRFHFVFHFTFGFYRHSLSIVHRHWCRHRIRRRRIHRDIVLAILFIQHS